MDNEGLRELFDQQVRAWVPKWPPLGAVVERDGPVVRIHYGTHGTVTHGDLPEDGLDDLIARQARAFTDRGERAEWQVYAHGTPADLGDRLRAAGFMAGWTRQVFVAGPDTLVDGELPEDAAIEERHEGLPGVAEATGPHRTPIGELVADDRLSAWKTHTAALTRQGRILAGGWVELLADTDFAAIGGMTAPHPALLANLCTWARRPRGGASYVLAEADEALATLLARSGFLPITTVTSYRLPATGPAVRERPVVSLGDWEYRRIWDRFNADLQFKPGSHSLPAIAEPSPSVTWYLGALEDDGSLDELQRIVERGLRTCARPGENLYWLDWQHASYRFDPTRVGNPGQPRWPGGAYPDGDYYIYLTADLRLGTFGHPWEESLCVFGTDLLADVEHDLNALLGKALRRTD